MASNIPTRRLTRVTRTTAVKENENANARPSRIATRSKPGVVVASVDATVGGVTRATAASRAKAALANGDSKLEHPATKRKREALSEVTAVNKARVPTVKGKEKEIPKETFDGVVIKSKTTVARLPLRTVATTRHRPQPSAVIVKPTVQPNVLVAAEGKDENAMHIDTQATRDPLPSVAVKRSAISKDVNCIVPRRSPDQRRALLRNRKQVVEEVHERSVKRRRTSSEASEDAEYLEDVQGDTEDVIAAKIAAEIEAFANEEEAHPEHSNWDDLDADDSDDPLMVSEYVTEIFNYLRQVELTTMPSPNYMEAQRELAWKMRGILTDWLIQVHVRFRLLPETLFLCVNIIDRFLSSRIVSLAKLQLVGVTCMFIAAKFEEVLAPSVSHFLLCADSSYTEAEILQAERYVLKTLDWNMSYPNPVHYLRRISKADHYDVKVRTLGKYLLEISCLEWRLLAASPSLLAAAAIWLARLALGMEHWTPNLAHYSGYAESQIVPTANIMLNYILKPIRHESFHKKYAGKRYYKSSVYMREWALDRWVEDSLVDLATELPRLKAEIKLERESEEFRLREEELKQEDATVIAKSAIHPFSACRQ